MKIKVKKMYQKFLSILLATLMFFSTSVPGMQVFAQELDGGNQTTHEVKFVTEPQDTKITVKDADNKKVEPSKDDEHIFHLKEGSYIYSASAQGYKPVEDKEFKVEKNEEIKVELVKEEAVSDSELEKSSQSMRVTSQNIRAKALSIADINNYSFSIVDRTHDNAIIEHKKEGEEGYSDYLNNPSKFNQVVGKDQKISGLSVNFSFSYSGSEGIKEGDTLEIPAYLGTELQNASFANVPLADTSGVTLGTYSYNSGKFILSFSGEHVKNDNVQNFSALLTSSSVSVPNTTFGTSTNGEKTVIHGKVLDTNIVAGYEKKNADAPVGPGPLSLDNARINSFKIIDVANGNKEIDYRTSDQAEYEEYKNDPSKFSNAICENQSHSQIKYKLDISYKSDKVIRVGDTLTIPANAGTELANFSSQTLKDDKGNILGSWEYNGGEFRIKFSGDYIKNNAIKNFNAKFETGLIRQILGNGGMSTTLGDRKVVTGVLGKETLIAAREKLYVVADNVGTYRKSISKSADASSDRLIKWRILLFNDQAQKMVDGVNKSFYNPYLLEHNGQYEPKSFTNVFVEDTFTDVLKAPDLYTMTTYLSGITDEGKVMSGQIPTKIPLSVLKKVSQGTQTKDQIKQSLQQGEYCMFDNGDETHTFLARWWDFNDSNGLTYNDIPEVASAGGVGNYLKLVEPDLFGGLKQETIDKINQIYDGKAIQNVNLVFQAKYTSVKEVTEIPNTINYHTDQTGSKEKTITGVLTPPAGIADAPADPLSIKLIKSDRKTGAMLSEGFKFELQTSTDGKTWTAVNVENANVELGTLNADKTLTPSDKGIVQLKGLKVGKYRFVEKAHPEGYDDVTINDAKPNSTQNYTSANSKGIELNNQGTGKVVAMYNNPKGEKIDINVTKKWVGPEKESVTVKLLADGQETGKTLTLTKAENWEGTFRDLDKLNVNGGEIMYDVAEVNIPLYESTKTGNASNGFIITNKHVPPKKEVFTGSSTTNIDGQAVQPGQELTYKITYKNTTGKEVEATITDKIPAHTTFVSADNEGVEKDGTITWKKKVANGESFEVSFKVTVNGDVNGAPLDNTAKVNDGENEHDTNVVHNPTPTTPKKEVFTGSSTTNIDGQVVQPGQELTYKITYTNTTGKDVDATITDKIPAHTTFVSADNEGVEKDGTITWKKKVANGESFEVSFKVTVNGDVNGAPLDNTAKVNDGENEHDTNVVHNPTPTTPKKEVFKGNETTNIDGKEVKAGEVLTYKVSYKNTTGKEQKVVIEDMIPEFTSYVEGSATNGGVYQDGKITWTKDKVADGESFEVSFKVKVERSAGGENLKNEAIVKAGKNKLKTNPTTNPVSEIPPTTPKKEVFKGNETTNIDGKEVKVGEVLTYKVSYKNTTGKEQKVVIEDMIPEFTSYVEDSATNGGIYKDGKLTWTKEKLADGEIFEVTFKVKVEKAAAGETLTNEALVRAGKNELKTNETHNPTEPNIPENGTPKTGDNTSIKLFVLMIVISGTALVAISGLKKKKEYQK